MPANGSEQFVFFEDSEMFGFPILARRIKHWAVSEDGENLLLLCERKNELNVVRFPWKNDWNPHRVKEMEFLRIPESDLLAILERHNAKQG